MVLNHSIVGPMVDNHRKPSVTNGCLTQKPSKNHRFQWLPLFDGIKNLPFSSICSKNYKKYSDSFALENKCEKSNNVSKVC